MEPSRVALTGLNHWGYRSLAGVLLRDWALKDPALAARVSFHLPDFEHAADPLDTARRLAEGRPDLAGFSCFVWNVDRTRAVARELKRLSPGTRIVLGGPEAAATADRLLAEEPCVDWIAAGEGEETFAALLRHLFLGSHGLPEVPGLVRREGGRIVRSADAPLIDLTQAPPTYASGGGDPSPLQSLLETSRGCPFTCSFCDWGPRKMRYHPLARIDAELKALVPRSGYVFLCDADILMERARGAAILRSFLEAAEGRECVLHFETNPTFLNREHVELIAKAPRKFHLAFGLQSVNPRAHEAVKRGAFDLAKVEANVDMLRTAAPDANYSYSLIYGLPGDDLEGFRSTLDWALRRHAGHFCAGQLMMIPGADVNRQAAEFKIAHQSLPPYQAYETSTMSRADMRRARELSVWVGLLLQFKPLLSTVFPPGAAESLPPGGAVARLERWIAGLRAAGVDMTAGLPALETDGHRPDERIRAAGELLRADPLALAGALHATRRFADADAAAAR